MGHSQPADIFIPLHPRHFGCVERCVQSLRQNVQPGGSRICIVTAALPTNLRKLLDGLGCAYLHEADVIGTDAAGIVGGNKFFAQLLKWELRRFTTTPTYLVIDAAAVVLNSVELHAEKKPALFCENRFRFSWLMCFNYFFGQYPIPTAPVSGEICHFDCAILDEMIGKIQTRWNAPWMNATSAIIQQVNGTSFDAADAFGHYVNLFHAGRFSIASAPFSAGVETSAPQVVRMGTLGYNGRFANQIFQFAFLQSYAKRYRLQAECPPWIGCSLFGSESRLNESTLPVYREDKGDVEELIRLDLSQCQSNFELWGYFQDSRHWAANPREFQDLFVPLPFLKQPLDDAINRLRKPGQTLIAIHLRRGDFNGGPVFWPAPEEWYLAWLGEIWSTLPEPVLYVATDDPVNVLPKFAAYHPKTVADLNVTVNGAEFYPDFYLLSQCDVLGISNSTFSFAAAMLNQTAKSFVRPDPDLRKLIAFNPWNAEVQLRKIEPTRLAA